MNSISPILQPSGEKSEVEKEIEVSSSQTLMGRRVKREREEHVADKSEEESDLATKVSNVGQRKLPENWTPEQERQLSKIVNFFYNQPSLKGKKRFPWNQLKDGQLPTGKTPVQCSLKFSQIKSKPSKLADFLALASSSSSSSPSIEISSSVAMMGCRVKRKREEENDSEEESNIVTKVSTVAQESLDQEWTNSQLTQLSVIVNSIDHDLLSENGNRFPWRQIKDDQLPTGKTRKQCINKLFYLKKSKRSKSVASSKYAAFLALASTSSSSSSVPAVESQTQEIESPPQEIAPSKMEENIVWTKLENQIILQAIREGNKFKSLHCSDFPGKSIQALIDQFKLLKNSPEQNQAIYDLSFNEIEIPILPKSRKLFEWTPRENQIILQAIREGKKYTSLNCSDFQNRRVKSVKEQFYYLKESPVQDVQHEVFFESPNWKEKELTLLKTYIKSHRTNGKINWNTKDLKKLGLLKARTLHSIKRKARELVNESQELTDISSLYSTSSSSSSTTKAHQSQSTSMDNDWLPKEDEQLIKAFRPHLEPSNDENDLRIIWEDINEDELPRDLSRSEARYHVLKNDSGFQEFLISLTGAKDSEADTLIREYLSVCKRDEEESEWTRDEVYQMKIALKPFIEEENGGFIVRWTKIVTEKVPIDLLKCMNMVLRLMTRDPEMLKKIFMGDF